MSTAALLAGATRRIVRALIYVVVLLAVVAGVGWWWAGTQHSLDWTLQRFGEPAGVQAQGLTGSLREGARADELRWSQDGLQVRAEGVDFAWDVRALLGRNLRVNHLRARSLEVVDSRPPSDEAAKPPDSLALPLPAAVEEFALDRFRWQAAGGTPIEARQLRGHWRYDGSRHALTIDNVELDQGRVKGELSVGDTMPFPLKANLQGEIAAPVPGREQPVPLQVEVSADGPLTELPLSARLRADASAFPEGSAPSATARAVVTPWAEPLVLEAEAQVQRLDLASLWTGLPQTGLSGRLQLAPAEESRWRLEADLSNSRPGPWDRQQLPVAALKAEGEWRPGGPAVVRQFRAELGGGVAEGLGRWEGEDAWRLDTEIRQINPSALYTALAPAPISGRIEARGQGKAVEADVDLTAQAAPARARRAATSAPRTPRENGELDALLEALELRRIAGRARWADGQLTVRELDLRTRDARLQGALQAAPEKRSGQGRLQLQAPGLQADIDGRLAADQGGGTVQLQAADLARLIAWLQTLPGVPADRLRPLVGQAQLEGRWQGGWENPRVDARLAVPRLQLPAELAGGEPVQVQDARLAVNGSLDAARLQLEGRATRGELQARIATQGELARRDPAWALQLDTLQLNANGLPASPGEWRLALQRPLSLQWEPGGAASVGEGQAQLTAPTQPVSSVQVTWEPSRWQDGALQTAGRVTGLPLSWAALFAGRDLLGPQLAGDLRFDARWQLRTGDPLQLQAALEHRSGDLTVLAEDASGATVRVPAGIRTARVTVDNEGQQLRARLQFDSERAGRVDGEAVTQLAPGGPLGWQVLPDAPLNGRVEAALPRLRAWSVLAPPGWRVRGSLAAKVELGGTVTDPRLGGLVTAEDLAVRSVVDGIALQDGRLRARLDGQRVVVEQLTFRGAGADDPGTLSATGEAARGPDGFALRLEARLDRLRASVRSDRQATVSGQAQAQVGAEGVEITGALRVDRALIVLPEETAPKLGDDVVVRNLPPGVTLQPRKRSAGEGKPMRLAVDIDLGEDFRIRGRGIDSGLRGQVRVSGNDLADPRVNGEVRIVGGEFAAYGQRLAIERGILRFNGEATNPSLDLLAVRPRMQPKVGVQVSGFAQAPDVRLYSDTAMSEAEKLSWLVLGRSAAAGGAESALLQRAALALLASRGGAGGGTGGIAGKFGLDELSVRRDGEEGGAALTIGKRFADNLYATLERSLTGALGTLFVFYDVTSRLTLRAQAGERTAVDLIYRISYD